MTPPWRGCDVEGCERPHGARGFCPRHYKRMQRMGLLKNTRKPPRPRVDIPFFPEVTGICRDTEEPLWDDRVEGELESARNARLNRAVGICSNCPGRRACLQARNDYAEDGDLLFGVWGGQLFEAPKNAPGRPRVEGAA